MPVKELERDKDLGVVPEKKVEPPKQYAAVYNQSAMFICGCNIGLLSVIFNMSDQLARDHIVNAIFKGETTLLIGPKDLIETKVAKATEEAAKGCPALDKVHFACRPL